MPDSLLNSGCLSELANTDVPDLAANTPAAVDTSTGPSPGSVETCDAFESTGRVEEECDGEEEEEEGDEDDDSSK